jgi:tripartite-type tricarboxylate transporter receptor subunit TctC
MQRRTVITLVAGAALSPASFGQAAWPTQPIRLVVPYLA